MASAFAVKIIVAPALIGVASWIARRWGPSVGGWFVALPLTSGPVLFLLALERGPVFAKKACVGALLAITSLSAFALAYSWSARRWSWRWSSVAGCAAYVVCTLMLALFSTSLGWTFLAVSAILAGTIYMIPTGPNERRRTRAPAWETPVRMVLAAAMVWGLTSVAASVGPRVSGLLTPFPVAATILAAFTHSLDGGRAAAQLLRSLLIGLFSFAVFLLVVGTTIEHWSVGAAFVSATLATLAVHACVWYWIRERSGVAHAATTPTVIGA
jgi:hypothetical protein